MRESKTTVLTLLVARDFDGIAQLAATSNGLTRTLVSILHDKSELIRFRAAQALGLAAQIETSKRPERARTLIRGLFWAMNDESGSICWLAPEAIAEILFNMPTLRNEFLPILMSFIDEEPFQSGVHRAACRMSEIDPSGVVPFAARLTRSLADPTPTIRGHAALALGQSGDIYLISELQQIVADRSKFRRFDAVTSDFVEKTVGEAASEASARLAGSRPMTKM